MAFTRRKDLSNLRLKNGKDIGNVLPKYVLVAGPGRSGSTYLYNVMAQHPDVGTAGWKEAYLYRNESKLLSALQKSATKKVFLDVANRGFVDPKLREFLRNYSDIKPYSLVLIYLYLDQGERLASVLDFRKSRGMIEAYLPQRLAEKLLVSEIFCSRHLQSQQSPHYDTFILKTEKMQRDPTLLLAELDKMLGLRLDNTKPLVKAQFNERKDARILLLSSIGKLVANFLRWLGMAKTVEAIKTQHKVENFFFKNSHSPHRKADFSAGFQQSVSRANASLEGYLDRHAVERGCGWLVNKSNRDSGVR